MVKEYRVLTVGEAKQLLAQIPDSHDFLPLMVMADFHCAPIYKIALGFFDDTSISEGNPLRQEVYFEAVPIDSMEWDEGRYLQDDLGLDQLDLSEPKRDLMVIKIESDN